MAVEDEVRKASEQFYAAFNRMLNGDANPLAEVWSHSTGVTTMHPVGGQDRQEAGTWKIVHHHTDVSPAMLDVLRLLQAET